MTRRYLEAAQHVLMNDSFRYVGEWFGETSAVLEFETMIDGLQLNGVDMIHWDESDRIVRFKVMVRPFKALQALIPLMARELESHRPGRSLVAGVLNATLVLPAVIAVTNQPACSVNSAVSSHPLDSNRANDRASAAVRRSAADRCVDLAAHVDGAYVGYCVTLNKLSNYVRLANAGPDTASNVFIDLARRPPSHRDCADREHQRGRRDLQRHSLRDPIAGRRRDHRPRGGVRHVPERHSTGVHARRRCGEHRHGLRECEQPVH